jgi:hypothetical protein
MSRSSFISYSVGYYGVRYWIAPNIIHHRKLR